MQKVSPDLEKRIIILVQKENAISNALKLLMKPEQNLNLVLHELLKKREKNMTEN